MPASTRRSGSARESRSTFSKGRTRPSQSTNMPAFSATGATGKTTSAACDTALARTSRLTTKPALVDRLRGGPRAGQVVGVDAGHHEAAELPGGRGPRSRRCRAVRRTGGAPNGAEVDAGGGVGDRTATRQQVWQAAGLQRPALTGPPRDPASWAPVVRRGPAPRTARPETVASRSPTRSRRRRRARSRRRWPAPRERRPRHRGRCGSGEPFIFCRPREVNGAIETTLVPAAGGLAQPQEHDRRLVSSGSNPASTTTRPARGRRR